MPNKRMLHVHVKRVTRQVIDIPLVHVRVRLHVHVGVAGQDIDSGHMSHETDLSTCYMDMSEW